MFGSECLFLIPDTLSQSYGRLPITKLPVPAVGLPTTGSSKRGRQKQNKSDIVITAQKVSCGLGLTSWAVVSVRETILLARAGGWEPHTRAGICGSSEKGLPRCGEKEEGAEMMQETTVNGLGVRVRRVGLWL